MSEEKVEKKKLSKELLDKQIKSAEEFVNYANGQITQLQSQVQQNIGIANFARHLLSQFDLPEKVEEPKKATPLEVK